MAKFLLKRLGYGIVTVFITITITFFLIKAVPGDPLTSGGKNLPEQAKITFKAKYALDKPLLTQYGIYLKKLFLEGNLGDSMISIGKTTNDFLREHAPKSAIIGIVAFVFEFILGVLLGIVAAFNRGRWPDKVLGVVIVLGVCIPNFVVATLLQYLFAVKLDWLPISGFDGPKNIIMPAMALSFSGLAGYCKFMRNSTLSVIGEDYIVTARAKGVSRAALVLKHIIRNAIIPIITFAAPQLLFIFTGSFVIEDIFSIPGLGSNFIVAIRGRDYFVILGITVVISICYIIALVVVDILYALVDPRIRIDSSSK